MKGALYISPFAVSMSKMFILHSSRNSEAYKIFLACLPYSSNSLMELKPSIINDYSTFLESSWKMHNSNLKGLTLESEVSTKFDPKENTCSAIRRGSKIFSGRIICAHLTLMGKLNFTSVVASEQANPNLTNDYIDYKGVVTIRAVEDGLLYPTYALYTWVPHCGHRDEFKMVTVSFRKRHLEGLKGLLTPLDSYTWAASGISLTLLAVLLTTASLKNSQSLKAGLTFFIQSCHWILSSLSAQYHGTPAILRAVPHFPILIIICVWSFFLLGTVFYQGSMFSSLIAHTPFAVPSTLEYVVESGIQILTTSRIMAGEPRPTSMLRHIMDDVINTTDRSTKLFRTLIDLKSRVNFIFRFYMFEIGLNISEGHEVEFEDGTFKRVKDTFAIINVDYELDEVLEGVGFKGDPYILRHTEFPMFFADVPILISRGCMTSFIIDCCGRLAQSGLYKWWEDLDVLDVLLGNVKDASLKQLYRKLIAKRFFGAKNEIVFEEAKQVTLSALGGVIGLGGGILFFAGVAFVQELVSYQMLQYMAWKCKRGAGVVLTVLKIKILRRVWGFGSFC
ncbi:hypothetical protein Fcan01_28259 [Folsomia candida]|uniref:Ionotropic glutamate receptor C-terminal domain-containing protein n=1 Tax=Folsomia candida TaxID=158441 RepID=A0A226CU90_FOLCA|nr:hypothetical protein Fcan01_28259 [Folsomia candida]